jgi:hypothetical protein
MSRLFRVLDAESGKEPDVEEIALHEPWAKALIYCDMEGWAIQRMAPCYFSTNADSTGTRQPDGSASSGCLRARSCSAAEYPQFQVREIMTKLRARTLRAGR